MVIPNIKSMTVECTTAIQTINSVKTNSGFSLFKKAFTTGGSAAGALRLLMVMIAIVGLFSCQKEELNNPALNSTASDESLTSAGTNPGPSVDAGNLQRVVYSSSGRASSGNTATLYGNASSTNGAVSVIWTQILGNSIAVIEKPTNDTTNVSGLVPGVYTFILTATDIKGVSRRDSTHVTVLQKMTWTVEGVAREALVHPPTGAASLSSAVIFAFHGHNGDDLGFAERAFEINWPQAIVVYPQGLPTKSGKDKNGENPGWQSSVGEVNSNTGVQDQDLKFFDAMMVTLKNKYKVNSSQVFAHGWSDGGMFVYNVLWTARGSQLRALAPAAATLSTTSGKKAMPVIHVAGTSDPSVHFSNQQQTVSSVRTLDKCSSTGTTWATGPSGLLGTQYASSSYPPGVVFMQYDGGHAYPFTIPPYIVKFFKQVAGVQ